MALIDMHGIPDDVRDLASPARRNTPVRRRAADRRTQESTQPPSRWRAARAPGPWRVREYRCARRTRRLAALRDTGASVRAAERSQRVSLTLLGKDVQMRRIRHVGHAEQLDQVGDRGRTAAPDLLEELRLALGSELSPASRTPGRPPRDRHRGVQRPARRPPRGRACAVGGCRTLWSRWVAGRRRSWAAALPWP